MHRKTLEDLAYYRIREEIAGYCVSQEGSAIIQKREPFTSENKERIDELKTLSSQWQKALSSTTGLQLHSWLPTQDFL